MPCEIHFLIVHSLFYRQQKKIKQSTIFSYKCGTILQHGNKDTDAPVSNVSSIHKQVHHKYQPISTTSDDVNLKTNSSNGIISLESNGDI